MMPAMINCFNELLPSVGLIVCWLTSVIGAFYYIRIIKVMYFDPAAGAFDRRAPSLSFVAGLTGLATVLFFLFPSPVVDAANVAAHALFR